MKATKENAQELLSKHFDIIIKDAYEYKRGQFYAYELIAKGWAILDVMTRPSLNKNQKKVLIRFIEDI
jgi:hypothetical protein